MKNLKRTLSLALTSVMLFGMMVVGSSAAFADADEIVNTEAVEITAGLGLFAGSDGKFNPTGTVTRAQMATVIVKMLYGSEINADQFKDVDKFSDVASFEGGWAEGYINLCANHGIVSGYGDGTYKPGNSVTTAEAVTMIINALGVDAGEGTWPLTVMSKAEEMKLFADLAVKPGTNVALTRDQLAVIVLAGLQYSAEGETGYTINGSTIVFKDLMTAYIANGNTMTGIKEVTGEDSLWSSVFEVAPVFAGHITTNQATGADCTVVSDGEEEVWVDLETGLDMIGHYVDVYYAEEYETEDEPGKAYCVVDQAKYVKASGVNTAKEFKDCFGKVNNLADEITEVTNQYAVTVGVDVEEKTFTFDGEKNATNGTYAIYENKIIAYIANPSTTASKVNKVVTTEGKESITVSGLTVLSNTEDNDVVVEYDGIAKGDFVSVQKAQNLYYLTKATVVEGEITKIDGSTPSTIYVNGTKYTRFGLTGEGDIGLTRNPTADNFGKTYTFYVVGSKYIGWETAESNANVSDVVYVLGTYELKSTDTYGNNITKTYAQGVDMEGKEVSVLVGIDYAINDDPEAEKFSAEPADLGVSTLAAGYVTFGESSDSDAKKANVMTAKALDKTYDEENPDIYTGSITAQLKSDTTKLVNGEEVTFIGDSTKFILVDGQLGEALDIVVMTGSIKKDVASAPVVLSQDSAGNVNLEVMVISTTDLNVMAEDYIYVNGVNAATIGTDLYELSVYFTKTGEKETINLDAKPSNDAKNQFYTYSYDAAEEIYTLDTKQSDDNFKYAVEFKSLNKDYLIAEGITAFDASGAKVVDLRGSDTLKDSPVAAMTEVADLADAKDAGYKVVFDALVDADNEKVLNIYIRSVTEIVEDEI